MSQQTAYQNSARSLRRGELPDIFFKQSVGHNHANEFVKRGYLDRRGVALTMFDRDTLVNCAPKGLKAFQAFISFIDAYGEIFGDWKDLTGAINNATKARDDIVEGILYEPDYDRAAAILAHGFLDKNLEDLPTQNLNYLIRPNADALYDAKHHSVLHYIIVERLEKDSDVLHDVMDDPAAFAFRCSRLIDEEMNKNEKSRMLMLMDAGSAQRPTGYINPQDIFDKEQELEEMKANPNVTAQEIEDFEKEVFGLKEKREKFENNLDRHVKGPHVRELHNLKTDKGSDAKKHQKQPVIGDIKDFSYYIVDQQMSMLDQISYARDLIGPKETETAIAGLYKNFGKAVKKANKTGRDIAEQLKIQRATELSRQMPEGQINPAELTRVIIDPSYNTPYMDKVQTTGASMDTAVTFLIDNSKSMEGRDKIVLAMITAERLSYWLSQAGIETEILGYTTGENLSDLPHNGRAVPLHNIIYKEQRDKSPKRILNNMSAMLNRDLLKTNTDSESIAWAYNRMRSNPQQRQILIVMNDGEPSGPYMFNGIGYYLDKKELLKKHLRHTVQWIEKFSPVEIIGIGIMTDVSQFYTNSVRINKPSDLLTATSEQLLATLSTPAEATKNFGKPLPLLRNTKPVHTLPLKFK